jgi:hypothetical protein
MKSHGRDTAVHEGGPHSHESHSGHRRDRSRSRDHLPLKAGRDRSHHNRDRDHLGPRNPRDRTSTLQSRSGGRQDSNKENLPAYEIVKVPLDEKIGTLEDDPRGNDPTKRITKKASGRGKGRNTESFDPASTLVRPDLRIQIGSPALKSYKKPLKHDDVVIVPELFGQEDDWDLYYKLVEEMRCIQSDSDPNSEPHSKASREAGVDDADADADVDGKRSTRVTVDKKTRKGAEWISWHEGAHLITKNPTGSPTYNKIVARLCEYFSIDPKNTGTRFNWYRDSSDWKPFHHDSAAFNPQRARNQNITVGASFGATRELAFIRTKEYKDHGSCEGDGSGEKCKLYFPQMNNGVFSFGRDANINWKHGINALPPSEQNGKGRISIILWGNASKAIDEEGSPPLLGADGRGPHADNRRNNHGRGRNYRGREERGGRGRENGRRRGDRNYDHYRDLDRHHNNDMRRADSHRRDHYRHDNHDHRHHDQQRGPPARNNERDGRDRHYH